MGRVVNPVLLGILLAVVILSAVALSANAETLELVKIERSVYEGQTISVYESQYTSIYESYPAPGGGK